MNKPITITRYTHLPRQTAELMLKIDYLADGDSGTPPSEKRELRTLRCLDDALSILAERSGGASEAETSPIIQQVLQGGWVGDALLANVQNISPLPNVLLNNFNTRVGFRCPLATEAELLSRFVNAQKKMSAIIQRLPNRHAICYSEGFEDPIIIRTPDIHMGTCPTDEDIERIMAPLLEDAKKQLILSPLFEDSCQPICYIEPDEDQAEDSPDQTEPKEPDKPEIIADYTRFLSVVLENKNLSARELNNALGVSAGKGVRLKSQMAANGFITIRKESGPTGRPREIVVVTERGLQFFEQWKHQHEI